MDAFFREDVFLVLKQHIPHAWKTAVPALETGWKATKHINSNRVEMHKHNIQKHVAFLNHILWTAISKIRYGHFNDNLQYA